MSIMITAMLFAALSAPSQVVPQPGDTYELCAMTFSDGKVYGTTSEPCADARVTDGISINGVHVQACTLPHGDICFRYRYSREGDYRLFYDIYAG